MAEMQCALSELTRAQLIPSQIFLTAFSSFVFILIKCFLFLYKIASKVQLCDNSFALVVVRHN